MPVLAVIEVAFDPLLRVGDVALPWQTLGVTAALLLGFALAALLSRHGSAAAAILRPAPPRGLHRPVRRRMIGGDYPEAPQVEAARPPAEPLRLDDLLFVVLGVVPGAVLGGRLVHGLAFWEAYAAQPERLLDPQVGSLSLLGAVLGGTLSAALVCRLLEAPVRRWADTAALPLLVVLGLGKLAQFLGGSGQGLPFDGPWAVAFAGPGPWTSASAQVPSHPAQVYEGLWILLGIPLVLLVAASRAGLRSVLPVEGRLFVLALGWFLLGRIIVGFTWRDDPVLGLLNAEQLLALAALVLISALIVAHAVRRRRRVGMSGPTRYRDVVAKDTTSDPSTREPPP
jgi:prolipoprotein diacylglyceryltransferase